MTVTSRPARPATRVQLNHIHPNPRQPRREFSERMICELAASIKRVGLLSPLVVRETELGEYELIAGERRFRALKTIESESADCIIIQASDHDAAFIALIENIQRENLNAFEEALAYKRIIDEYGMTQDALAKKLGKSPSAVANRLRLLKLSEAERALILRHGLTERHARALLSCPDDESRRAALEAAVAGSFNVRELEDYIEARNKRGQGKRIKLVVRDHRLLVNAVLDTVRSLKSAGVNAGAKVIEKDDIVEVVVTLPRIGKR